MTYEFQPGRRGFVFLVSFFLLSFSFSFLRGHFRICFFFLFSAVAGFLDLALLERSKNGSRFNAALGQETYLRTFTLNPSNFHLLVHTPFVSLLWGGGGSAKVVLSLERAFDCFLLTLACLCCLCLLMLYVFLRLLSLFLFPMGSPFSIGDSGSFLLVFSWLNRDWGFGGVGLGGETKK
ncbi:hypothetical protein P167DRAFT_154470 [Morchella conica CCBAS932]|uniref:Transmembrane protein n=1 Tax=Morchella conica CCBAS932 TaxID=1392247 RepID=A0A3N4L404_9PEZI|nr:hypothetical protein P167DRAFT_154470 [Morchella conica CCBAS932]